MFKPTVQVKKSFAILRKNGKVVVNKKGKPKKVPVYHRSLFLDGQDPIFDIKHYKIVCYNRTVGYLCSKCSTCGQKSKCQECGCDELEPVKEKKFSISYIPAPVKASYWDKGVEQTKFVREKEPNGKVTPAHDLDHILNWLKFKVENPNQVIVDLTTAEVGDEYLEEAA